MAGRRSEPPISTLESAPAYRPTPSSNAPSAAPSFASLRGELVESSADRVRARFSVDRCWHNAAGVLQGGVLTAMLDVVIDLCARAIDPHRQSATLELSVRFFRAVRSGSILVEGVVLRGGRRRSPSNAPRGTTRARSRRRRRRRSSTSRDQAKRRSTKRSMMRGTNV